MAKGPITLLVDPAVALYQDRTGIHTLPWHGPQLIGRPVRIFDQPNHAVAFTANIGDIPATIVNRHGMFGSGTPLSDWTVTNGTKSSQSYSATVNKFTDNDFFQSDIYGYSGQGFGFASNSRNGSFTVLKAVSTGGDMDITTPLAVDSGTQWTARALLASDAAVDRRATFIINGVEHGMNPAFYPAHMIPAGGLTVLHGAHDFGQPQATASQAFGVRVKDTAVGEAFYLLQMGTNDIDEHGGIAFWPVSGPGNVYPTTMLDDVTGLGTVTPWEGAVGNSIAHSADAFWYVEATALHIPDDTNFVLLARFHEMVRPVDHYGEEIGVFNIGRYQAIYDYDTTPGMMAEIGVSDEFTFDPLLPRVCVADIYNATTDSKGVAANFPRLDHTVESSGVNFHTYGLTITPTYTTVHRDTESATETWDRPPWRGWMGFDLPTPDDPIRFAPGHGRDHFHPSIGAYREMAIAERPLTDGEWAYLADPDAIWSFNMFAPPAIAVASGLESPLYRGDDRAIILQIQDEDGDPVPLHGLKVWATLKDKSDGSTTDDSALIKASAEFDPTGAIVGGAGIEPIDLLAGTFRVPFEVPSQNVKFDVQTVNVSGELRTILTGAFDTTPDITKRETMP